MVWNSEGKGGLSILEFPKARGGLDEDAARGRVWIFSGITHFRIQQGSQNSTQLFHDFLSNSMTPKLTRGLVKTMSEMSYWVNVLMLDTIKFPIISLLFNHQLKHFWEKSEIPWHFHGISMTQTNYFFLISTTFPGLECKFQISRLSMTFP